MEKRYCTICNRKFTPRTESSIHCAMCKTVENFMAQIPTWQAVRYAHWVTGLSNARIESEQKMTA